MKKILPFSSHLKPRPKAVPARNWACSACTLENDALALFCDACGAPAAANDLRVGGHPSPPPPPSPPANTNPTVPSSSPGGLPPKPPGSQQASPSKQPNKIPPQRRANAEAYIKQFRDNLSNAPGEQVVVTVSVQFSNGQQMENTIVQSADVVQRRVWKLIASPEADEEKGSPERRGNSSAASSPGDSASKPPPAYDPQVGFGAGAVHQESFANAGKAGGERVLPPRADGAFLGNEALLDEELNRNDSRNSATTGSVSSSGNQKGPNNKSSSKGKLGPAQRPPSEVISLRDRNQQLADGGGARVNQNSGERFYDLGNYERSVYIDPLRHTREVVKTEEERAGPTNAAAENSGVPVEVAAVGSKIRNLLRVGGERVKEMDHFVATVETPEVRLALNSGDSNSDNTGLRRNDIGAFVQKAVRQDNLTQSASFPINSISHGLQSFGPVTFELLVEKQYSDRIRQSKPLDSCYIVKYCQLFYWLLTHVYDILQLELSSRTTQLYYMTTMRADDLVCSVAAAPDNRIYINAMVFEQAACCDLVGDDAHQPIRISLEKYRELLTTWVTRVAVAVQKHRGSSKEQVVGLYDKAVRTRLYDKLLQLLGDQGNSRLSSFDYAVALSGSSAVAPSNPQNWSAIETAKYALQEASREGREKEDDALTTMAQERLALLNGSRTSISTAATPSMATDSPTVKQQQRSVDSVRGAQVAKPDNTSAYKPESLQQLEALFADSVYSRPQLVEALVRSNGDLNVAADYLFSMA